MIICNVTMQVAWKIHDEWLTWMKTDHIPAMMKEGAFERYQLSRLREVQEEEGPTYCIQYYASESTPVLVWKDDEQSFTNRIRQRWGNDCLAFRTLMEVIH